MKGGDDIMLAGPGIQRSEGMQGFDWVTHKNDPLPADSDMDFTGLLPPGVETNRDRFDLVEALSGWTKDDILRGDDRVADDLGVEHTLNPAGIDRIAGLRALLPAGTTSFNAGNIIIGGAGSDTIEGRGGDDLINGDAWLNTRLSVRSDDGLRHRDRVGRGHDQDRTWPAACRPCGRPCSPERSTRATS